MYEEDYFFWYSPLVFKAYEEAGWINRELEGHLILPDPINFIRGSQRIETNGKVLFIKGEQVYIDALLPEEADELNI